MALGGLRRPQFHKGQYGSALGSFAPAAQLLAQAGRTQGAAFRGLADAARGAMEKYQLNKEKRERNEAAAMGTIRGMRQNNPQALQALSQDPTIAKVLKNIETEKASPKDFNVFNSAAASYKAQETDSLKRQNMIVQNSLLGAQGDVTKLKADLDRITQDDRARAIHNETYATTLANQGEELRQRLLKAKDKREKEGIEREIELHGLKVEGAIGANLEGSNRRQLFKDTYLNTVKRIEAERQIAEAEVLINKAKPALMKAQTKLTQMQALGQDIENKAEEAGKKYPVGEVVTKKGSDYIWTGNTLQPIAGQITQATLDSAALRIWGDELLLYYQDTRDDQTGKINHPEDIDPRKERLLIMMKMGTLDDIEGIKDADLKNKLKLEIESLMATPESPSGITPQKRLTLARKALNDPNATPAERQRAQEIINSAQQPSR
jgi:hypothetical protein